MRGTEQRVGHSMGIEITVHLHLRLVYLAYIKMKVK